jgi:hypothetical protein
LAAPALPVWLYREGEFLAAIILGVFALLLFTAALVTLARRRLVREMQSAPTVADTAGPRIPADALPRAPAPMTSTPLGFVYLSRTIEVPPEARQLTELIGSRHMAMLKSLRRRTWLSLALALAIAITVEPESVGPVSVVLILSVLAIGALTVPVRWISTRSFRQLAYGLMWRFATWLFYLATAYVAFAAATGAFPWIAMAIALAGWSMVLLARLYSRRSATRYARETPPVDVLMLWVFAADEASGSLVANFGPLWSGVGRVRLLRGGMLTAMPSEIGRALTGRAKSVLCATVTDVDARMTKFERAGLNRYGIYDQQMLLCADTSWQHALKIWLQWPTLIMMSLAGLSATNAGCAIEIRRLIHEIPIARCVFLIDGTTNRSFLEATMQDAWMSRPESSPNAAAEPVVQLLELAEKGVGQHVPAGSGADAKDLDDPHLIDRDIDHICGMLAYAAVRSGLYPPNSQRRAAASVPYRGQA